MRVPPGGFAAFGQESPATQALWGRYMRANGSTGTRRRRKKKTTGMKRRKRRTASASRPRRSRRGPLRKGSAAAKRRMAQLRKMRRK